MDNTIKVWSLSDGQCQQALAGHSGFVYTVAWSFDAKLLASGGDDARIILWDAKKGEWLTELKGHR